MTNLAGLGRTRIDRFAGRMSDFGHKAARSQRPCGGVLLAVATRQLRRSGRRGDPCLSETLSSEIICPLARTVGFELVVKLRNVLVLFAVRCQSCRMDALLSEVDEGITVEACVANRATRFARSACHVRSDQNHKREFRITTRTQPAVSASRYDARGEGRIVRPAASIDIRMNLSMAANANSSLSRSSAISIMLCRSVIAFSPCGTHGRISARAPVSTTASNVEPVTLSQSN